MTIQEALQRLAQVLDKNARAYFYDLQYWLYEDYFNAIGIRRKSKGKCIRFYEDMEELEFDKVRAIIKDGDEFYHYRFSVEDLLANDWECVLMDMDCDFVDTFDDFLRSKNDEVVFLSDVEELGFFRLLREKIISIEIFCPYTSVVFTQAQQVLKNYHNQKITGKVDENLKAQWKAIVERNANTLISIDWESEV